MMFNLTGMLMLLDPVLYTASLCSVNPSNLHCTGKLIGQESSHADRFRPPQANSGGHEVIVHVTAADFPLVLVERRKKPGHPWQP